MEGLTIAKSTPAGRRHAERRGRAAEDTVAERWQAAGFNILARRLRTGAGEIDLVAANVDRLVFIEVKARDSFTAAAHAVPPRQQARLLEAAGAALATHADWQRPETSFDVALVCGGAIHHIEDAIRYG
jgi:putative endonuclease